LKSPRRAARTPVAATALVVGLVACSSTGGSQSPGGGEATSSNQPREVMAMVGHWSPSDSFVDILRKGAEHSAVVNNGDLRYASDPQPNNQGIKGAGVAFAVDQQPWLQGYQAIDTLSNYLLNRSVLGGGTPILTGPSYTDKKNIDQNPTHATEGIR
jgi:ABC-type sugar transport system substrate-binding protein